MIRVKTLRLSGLIGMISLYLSSSACSIHLWMSTHDGMPTLWLVPAAMSAIAGTTLLYQTLDRVCRGEFSDSSKG